MKDRDRIVQTSLLLVHIFSGVFIQQNHITSCVNTGTMAGTEDSHLHDLVTLITSSVDDIISEYKTTGASIPLLDSAVDGPFDAPERASERLLRTIRIVEAACAQLCATIASPALSLVNVSLPHLSSAPRNI